MNVFVDNITESKVNAALNSNEPVIIPFHGWEIVVIQKQDGTRHAYYSDTSGG